MTRRSSRRSSHEDDAKRLHRVFQERKKENPSLTQEMVAAMCGWSTQGAVSHYMMGKTPINLEALLKLSKALNVTPEQISPSMASEFGLSEKNIQNMSGIRLVDVGKREIPLLLFSNNSWSDYMNDFFAYKPEKTILVTEDVGAKAFAIMIEDRAMCPDINPGDVVVIDPEIIPEPGDYVVSKSSDGPKFMKYRPRGQGVYEIAPINTDFPTLKSDVDGLEIVGVMVEHRRYRRR